MNKKIFSLIIMNIIVLLGILGFLCYEIPGIFFAAVAVFIIISSFSAFIQYKLMQKKTSEKPAHLYKRVLSAHLLITICMFYSVLITAPFIFMQSRIIASCMLLFLLFSWILFLYALNPKLKLWYLEIPNNTARSSDPPPAKKGLIIIFFFFLLTILFSTAWIFH